MDQAPMFLLWSIIFGGSFMISELQEIVCKLNACAVLMATFQELNSLRNVMVWIFISSLCCSWCWSVAGSEGWGFFPYTVRNEKGSPGIRAEGTMLWSAKSHQGWRRVRCFQTIFSLSLVHLVYRLPLWQEIAASAGQSEGLSSCCSKALKS